MFVPLRLVELHLPAMGFVAVLASRTHVAIPPSALLPHGDKAAEDRSDETMSEQV